MPDAGATIVADPTRPIALVGMMASGKSTVGKRLAQRLGLPFVDTDAEIERRVGRPVAEIFAADGEPAFRAHERAVLTELLTAGTASVVATGGGAVIDPGTRELLEQRATVLWLHASPGVLAHRAQQQDAERPLLADDPRGALERLCAAREPWYRAVADATIEVDMVDRRVVLDRALVALAELGAVVTPAAQASTTDRLVP
jgi:shikimate kinase